MPIIIGLAFLILVVATTQVVTQFILSVEDTAEGRRAHRAPIWFGVLGTLFFLPFYLIGTLELIWATPRLSLTSLVLVQSAVTGLVLLGHYCFARPRGVGLAPGWGSLPETGDKLNWYSLGGILCIAGLVIFALLGVMLAVGFPRGFEVTAYHLPIAVNVFQTGSLRVWDHAFMHTFPANMSLIAGYSLQFLPERLASVLNLPFLALACFVVYRLGRMAGADSESSAVAAAGLATIPMIAFSSLEIGADVAGIAFLGLSFLIVLAAPSCRASWIILAGLCTGLAFGFKSLHLVGGGFLGLIVLIQGWKYRRNISKIARFNHSAKVGIYFACGFCLTAGFWLLRNAVELGNPIYPVHLGSVFDLLGWAKAPDVDYGGRSTTQFEWVRAQWEWLVYPWVEWHFIGQNFKHSSGMGAFFATTVPVAWAAAAIAVVRRNRSPEAEAECATSAACMTTLVSASLFIALVWWILDDRQPRYVMGAVIFSVPLVAWLLTSLSPNFRRWFKYLSAASVSIMFVVIASKQLIEFGSRFIVSNQTDRALYYEYPSEIDELPEGSVIVNMGSRPGNYALFGKRLSHRVLSPYRAATAIKAAGADRLTADVLRSLGATHIYMGGDSRRVVDECVALAEVGRLDRNPSNGVPLPQPRIIYRLNDPLNRCR